MNTSTKIRLGAAVGMAVVAVIWIFQNGTPVETKFLFFTLSMPQSALLAITLLAGIATGILLAWSLAGKWSKPKGEPPSEPDK
ncbi:MAG: LapA family protein [Lentisphaeria bacterium]|nr:LapA family protein [Lentisphaeria bacterium]